MPKKSAKTNVANEKVQPQVVHHHKRRWSIIIPALSFLLLIFTMAFVVYVRYFARYFTSTVTRTAAQDTVTLPSGSSSGSSGSGVTDSVGMPEKSATNASNLFVIKTGQFSVTVSSASDAVQKITDIAKDLKGSVVSSVLSNAASCGSVMPMYYTMDSSTYAYPYASCYDATITIRVPESSFVNAQDKIEKLDENAKFDSESTQEVDVTTQVSDLQTQLASYESEQTSLQKLLDTATAIDDILKIRTELTQVSAQVQVLKQQIRDLDKHVQYAELTINVSKVGSQVSASQPSVSARFADAWAAMKQDLSNIGTGLIYFAVYAIIYVPILLAILVAFWLVKRLMHRVMRGKK